MDAPVAVRLAKLKREAEKEWRKKWRQKLGKAAPSSAAEWRALGGAHREEGLLDRAVAVGERMLARLEPAEKLDVVGEVRGVGAMLGVELVPDRDAGPVALAARRKGVIVRASGQKIVMSPPLVITDEQADTIVDVLVEELGRL